MPIVKYFDLYLNEGVSVAPVIHANQYDETEQWIFTLYEESGTKYTPSTGAIIGMKKDGKGILNTATVNSNGQVVVNETKQMTAAAGTGIFELLIDSLKHGTANFKVEVKPRPADNADMSDSDYSLLQNAVYSAEEILDIIGDTDLEEIVRDDIDAWLDAHPEATTTVEDGSITLSKLASDIHDDVASIPDLKSAFEEFPTGIYPNMTVGSLMSEEYTEDKTPYLYRVSGGGGEVGKIEADKIVGGTIAWNQLVNITFATITSNGVTFTNNGDGTVTVNGTATRDATAQLVGTLPVINGHKYLYKGCPSGGSVSTYCIQSSGTSEYGNGAIISNTASTRYFWISVKEGVTVTNLVFKPQIFDLTQMFGSTIADYIYSLEQANAGAGVAFFRSLFPNDYYEYNAGELLSVSGLSAHKMTGFNQLDEATAFSALGNITKDGDHWTGTIEKWINLTTGTGKSGWENIRYLEKTAYYCAAKVRLSASGTTNVKIRVIYTDGTTEDSGKEAIVTQGNTGVTYLRTNGEKTVKGIAFTYGSGITGVLDVYWMNINLSDPTRNGEYEPYVKHSYSLDSSLELRGIPKLDSNNKLYYDGDIYYADGTVTRRYGIVDLGTLTWSKFDANNGNVFVATVNDAIKRDNAFVTYILCSKYTEDTTTSNAYYIADKTCKFGGSYFGKSKLTIVDSSYTDAATFKTAMSGVYLVYELATPTEETAQPYTEYQKVSKYGTEEYVSTGIVPVGHITKYPTDIVSKVDGLPSDFSTLIAPTEKGFTATRAYSVNQFMIINNQLYKATTSIANGATITVGTNVTATTIADILTSLLNA